MHFQPVLRRWYLWSELQELSDSFNRHMNVEHVEDKLTDKQVVMTDEHYQLMDQLRLEGDNYVPLSTKRSNRSFYPELSESQLEEAQKPQRYIRKIAEVNQLRRNLLLLKDWNRKRPWKQLYCFFDTSADGDYGPRSWDETRHGFHDEITNFHTHLASLHLANPQHIVDGKRDFNPSNNANIYSSLFPIHPCASHAIPPSIQQADWDMGCIICADEWDVVSRKLIIQLHCNHFFHYTCIRQVWDDIDKQTFQCPICRQNDWVLKDTAAVTAEVNDVWDFEAAVGSQVIQGTLSTGAFAAPDLNDFYYDTEAHTRRVTRYWDVNKGAGGYPELFINPVTGRTELAQYNGRESFERDARLEMANVRQYRRITNKRRRLAVEEAKSGVKGLDPIDPNPNGIPPPFIPQVNTFNAQTPHPESFEMSGIDYGSDEDVDEDEDDDEDDAEVGIELAGDQAYLDDDSDEDEPDSDGD